MSEQAPWWDNPDSGNGDTPVIRHAPDNDGYHYPDANESGKMRGSRVGAFVTIPASRRDGASRGFDHSVAVPVHVDPGAPDGGVIFDASQISRGQLDQAIAQSYYPHQAFYKLGVSARKRDAAQASLPEATEPRSNPLMRGSYVVPQAGSGGVQLPGSTLDKESSMPPLNAPLPAPPPALSFAPMPVQQPAAAAPGYPPQYSPQPAYPTQAYQPQSQTDPGLLVMLNSLANGLAGLSQRFDSLQQPPQPTAPPLPVGLPALRTLPRGTPPTHARNAPGDPEQFADEQARPIRRRAPRPGDEEEEETPRRRSPSVLDAPQQEQRDDENARDGRILGFETLELPFVRGPEATKPGVQVFFDTPGVGRFSAHYHQVIDSPLCLCLVYDTRYEGGMQYAPEPRPAQETVTLTLSSSKKAYPVASMGMQFTFGVFDIIVLPKRLAPAEPRDELE